MADTVLTLAQLKKLFQNWTSQQLGLTDPSIVRIAWPTEGAPAWKVTDNVCFLFFRYTSDQYTEAMITEYSQADPDNAYSTLKYTAGINVTWMHYGPNCFDNADLVRARLFTSSTTGFLRSNNLSLIPNVRLPLHMPEVRNGQWWDKASFDADFYQLVERQDTVPYIQTVNWNLTKG